MAIETTWTVSGMTCEHCDRHVADAARELPGVTAATADHATGTLATTSESPLPATDLAAVLEEAGYELQH